MLRLMKVSTALTKFPRKPMPREPEDAATTAAMSLMTWNAVWNFVMVDYRGALKPQTVIRCRRIE